MLGQKEAKGGVDQKYDRIVSTAPGRVCRYTGRRMPNCSISSECSLLKGYYRATSADDWSREVGICQIHFRDERFRKWRWGCLSDSSPHRATGDDGPPGQLRLATMTPLERWRGDPRFLTKERAEALQRSEGQRRAKSREATSPCRRIARRRRWVATPTNRNRSLKFGRSAGAALSVSITVSG
jgi:hypothetical protein